MPAWKTPKAMRHEDDLDDKIVGTLREGSAMTTWSEISRNMYYPDPAKHKRFLDWQRKRKAAGSAGCCRSGGSSCA